MRNAPGERTDREGGGRREGGRRLRFTGCSLNKANETRRSCRDFRVRANSRTRAREMIDRRRSFTGSSQTVLILLLLLLPLARPPSAPRRRSHYYAPNELVTGVLVGFLLERDRDDRTTGLRTTAARAVRGNPCFQLSTMIIMIIGRYIYIFIIDFRGKLSAKIRRGEPSSFLAARARPLLVADPSHRNGGILLVTSGWPRRRDGVGISGGDG